MQERLEGVGHNESDYFVEGADFAALVNCSADADGQIGSIARAGFALYWHGEGTMGAAVVGCGAGLAAKFQGLIRSNPGLCLCATGCIRDCRDAALDVFPASEVLLVLGSVFPA